MNLDKIWQALKIIFVVLLFGFLVIKLSNVNSDKEDYKIKNKVFQKQDSLIQIKCDSIEKKLDSIEYQKHLMDIQIDSISKTKVKIHNIYRQNEKHWLDNDSTVYYIKQYLSGYIERQF
jgi:hypothetical protein